MTISRRQLLQGSAMIGLISSSTPALACSRDFESPLAWSFWRGRYNRLLVAPRREREFIDRFLEAVLTGNRLELVHVLAPDCVLFIAPDGTPHWTKQPRKLARSRALDHLAKLVNRTGPKGYRIGHFSSISKHISFLIDATFEGTGRPVELPKGDGPYPVTSEYGICGEKLGQEWSRRVILKLRLAPYDPRVLGELRIESMVWVE